MNKNLKFKKCIAIVALLAMTFTACGAEELAMPFSEYDLSQYVTLGEYKGVEIEEINIEITDADVDTEIGYRLEAATTEIEQDYGIVEMGDSVRIVYTGKIDDEVFEGGSTGEEGIIIEVGNAGYIEGFEEQLVGMEVGDTKDLDLQFPHDYHVPELAGEDVIFTSTILAEIVTETPDLDLNFIATQGDYEDIEAYKADVKSQLEIDADEFSEYTMQDMLWTQIVEETEVIELPVEEVQKIMDENRSADEMAAAQYGMEFDAYLTTAGMTTEQYEEQLTLIAEETVKVGMILMSIANNEGIEISREEYDTWLEDFMVEMQYGTPESFEEEYGESFEDAVGQDNILINMLFEEVIDFVYESAVKVPPSSETTVENPTEQNAEEAPSEEAAVEEAPTEETPTEETAE